MASPTLTLPPLRGRAFEIDALVRVRAWAGRSGHRLVVELDRTLEGEGCEEVICLLPARRRRPCVLIWREREGVGMATGSQAARCFPTLEAALARCGRPAGWRLWRQAE